MIALTVLCGIAVLISSIMLFNRELNINMRERLDVASAVVMHEIDSLKSTASIAAMGMANNPDLIEAFASSDYEKIASTASALINVTQFDFCTVVDREGNVLTRTHDPGNTDGSLADLPHVREALEGKSETFIVAGVTIKLGIMAGSPIYDSDMNIIGAVSLGYRLDSQERVLGLRDLTGCEITFFLGDERISTTLVDESGSFILGLKAAEDISEHVLNGEQFNGFIDLLGRNVLAVYSPLLGEGDRIVGMMFIGYFTDEVTDKVIYFVISGTLLTIAVLVGCVITAMYLSGFINQRLGNAQKRLAEEMDKTKALSQWYESILDATPLPISVTDADMNWTFVNKAVENFLGTRREDMIGLHCSNWGSSICNTYACGIVCAKQGLNKTYFNHEDKSYQIDICIISDADDKATGFIEVMQDITYIREHEKKLQAVNQAATLLLAASENKDIRASLIKGMEIVGESINADRIHIWKSEVIGGENQYIREYSWMSETGKRKAEIPGRLKNPGGKNRFGWNDTFMLGESIGGPVRKMAESDRIFFSELDIKSIIMIPLFLEGRFWGFFSVDSCTEERDYTDDEVNILRSISLMMANVINRRSLFERMNEVRERATLMLNASPICAQIFDRQYNVLDCNDAALSMYGFSSKHEFAERFLRDCSPEFQPDGQSSYNKSIELIDKVFREGYSVFEWMHKMPNDDTSIPAEITLVRARYGDDYVVIGYAKDIRAQNAYLAELEKSQEERVARNAAEAASRSKSMFLANMSHEIRTPMNSIIGFAELAKDDDVPAKTKEHLGNIQESAEWLLSIINDILDISKIEAGKITLESIPFNLTDIFSYCQTVVLPRALEKGISLYCYAEPIVEKKLLGDPIRLRQVLINLLSNAVKFTNVGTVKLLSTITDIDESSVKIYFEIKDSGIGMSAEQISEIFEPFVQADDSVTRKFGGTGLGLAISKNVIELMGGKIDVESADGVGSKFFFELEFNLIDSDESTPDEEDSGRELERPNFIGEVLICEDSKLNQQVVCEHLLRVGLKTVLADNGKEGFDFVEERVRKNKKPFDLIFMDIQMPVMDGLTAASKIVELGVTTPIIALTANVMSNDLETYAANGILECVGKPFTTRELWKCLMRHLPVESYTSVENNYQAARDRELLDKLRINFVSANKSTYEKFVNALDSGDIKTAHRLVHTLKSNAGQIKETQLQTIAAKTESTLIESEELINDDLLRRLEFELNTVLEKYAFLLVEKEESRALITDVDDIRRILKKLEPLLRNKSTKCLNLLDDIYTIPGTKELACHIREYNFKTALAELESLKTEYGVK